MAVKSAVNNGDNGVRRRHSRRAAPAISRPAWLVEPEEAVRRRVLDGEAKTLPARSLRPQIGSLLTERGLCSLTS